MSDVVKLSSALPADANVNGLDSEAQDLLDDPRQIRAGIVWYHASKIVENTDDSTRVPYVRIRRFEPLGPIEKVSAELQRMLQEAVEERTGTPPLPFDTAEAFEVED